MTTIKDVAKKAGVSIAIVSKALNNYPDVSDKTKKRIIELAKEMNYTPNVVAKNLSSKKQKTIGLITSGFLNSEGKDNSNSFDLFRGVYTAAEENQYELAIYFTDTLKQKQKSYAKFCQERNIGGAVLMGMRVDDPFFEELLDTDIPCVLVDINTKKHYDNIGSVSTDNIQASFDIATYLLKHNHRNIVVVAGAKSADVNIQRLKGVERAFEEYGLELTEESILYGNFSEEESYRKTKEYLENANNIPTAMLCFSDLMAYGTMKAIKEAELEIPSNISITGFDGLVINEYIQPTLTTVKQDFYEIGSQAALLLEQLMEKKKVETKRNVKHQIIERESVRSLAK
ncbi:LacI family transcriptional regulator/LacI family purine nucleotide synthesis repressor [Virgibacillus natechei]|uniref:LacI family transcriptional regulator/LacI family purine nucleotide synthesis repressor n=1 Tax=Virgibacillus natechei TaxID=1216297 RepID=A0ABS4IKC7_9BACI|nr:LacI family DNA-binding transcriptional regulator [Virgibacillus natechei]MBP1971355.1 LacI family transcriptional regulator/LacI family purine nucleotide synthesis repressor [Virgibacillus natechei]UZD12910.1 LacI family transcriptional regulator [Virgibacillus natechei]